MEITIQNLLTALTMIGTLITLHIRVCHNFFMSILKKNYKEVPGEQSIFEMILNWLAYIGIISYFIIMISLIIASFSKTRVSSNNYSSNTIKVLVIMTIYIIIFIASCYSCYKISKRFICLQAQFVNKLEGKEIKMDKYAHRKNIVDIIIVAIQLMMCSIIIFTIIFDNTTIYNSRIIIFQKEDDIPFVLFFAVIAFIMLTSMLIAITMNEVIKTLESNNTYVLFADSEIRCKCYLEYKNYYLVIKNNTEYYINKSKVNKIIKYRGLA